MTHMMLGLYLQSLLIAVFCVMGLSLLWWLFRLARRSDKTRQARQSALYDLIVINLLTIPILAFGILALQMMIKG